MRSLVSEPFVHFLVGGLVLLAIYSWYSGEREDRDAARRIVVEPDALRAFVQARTQITDPVELDRIFEGLDAAARRDWVDRFVREEALVREARALGLDRDDDLIRRRLVQKIEFLSLGLLPSERVLDPRELEAFYLRRREAYRIPETLTFTHVFVRPTPGDADPAQERARALLRELNAGRARFEEALGLGDRFLYNRNYVGRTLEEVRSHFGAEMADRLSTQEPDATRWTGPHRSDHGLHLALLTARNPARIPDLSEIRGEIEEELRREQREAALDAAVDEIVSSYEVEIPASIEHGRAR